MEDEIDMLLELYPLDELFEVLDITPEQVLAILFKGGHVTLPPYLDKDDGTYEEQE